MAEPKKRQTSSKGKIRRSGHKKIKSFYTLCPKCHKPKLPHHVCLVCGTYKDEKVIDIPTAQVKKKVKKKK